MSSGVKKKTSYLNEGVCCTKNYWSLSNCRYVKVTPYMGIYIILETGIRVFFMYFLSLKSKVQKKNKLIGFTAEKTMYLILSPKNNFNKNLHIHIMILKQTDRNQSQLKHFKYHLLSHVVLGYSPVTRTIVSWGRRDMVVEWVVMLGSTLRRQLLLQDLW